MEPKGNEGGLLSALLSIAQAITNLRVQPVPVWSKVTTAETTTSTAAVNLATVGPEVSVTVGISGAVEVSLAVRVNNSGANYSEMAVAVSGATTRAVVGSEAISWNGTAVLRAGRTYVIDGLTPGVNVFTAKYYVSAGTGTFGDRYLTVTPI